MATFAQNYLKLFFNGSSLPDMSADEWMAELIFTPDIAYEKKVFNISDPRVVDALGLERRKPHYYSYHEVGMGLANNYKAWHGLFELPEDKLTASQKELMADYNKVEVFGQLSRSLSLMFPDFIIPAGPIADAFGVPANSALAFVDMLDHQEALDGLAKQVAQQLAHKSAAGPVFDNDTIKKIDELQKQMDTIGHDNQNELFKVIPPQWDEHKIGKLWYSPWAITFQGQGSPDVVKFLGLWKQLVAEYRSGKTTDFAMTAEALNTAAYALAGEAVSEPKLKLEVAYNDYQPFRISMGFYGVAFIYVSQNGRENLLWQRRIFVVGFCIPRHRTALSYDYYGETPCHQPIRVDYFCRLYGGVGGYGL
jgi:hypothetical protein